FDPNDYVRKATERYRFGALISGRGCPGRCTYCDQSVFGRKCARASVAALVADMKHRRNSFGVSNFYFIDDTLLWNKVAVRDLCRAIVDAPVLHDITWGCNGRPDQADDSLFTDMKNAGCDTITFGLESGDPDTLRIVNKGIALDTMLVTVGKAI
ncbi:MAG: radical SAM protein, partial [Candidatus Edwardsbacteria bacterium]|nr:radical SAM protein [Candidatus Edwardsbacteria bacterium]